MNSRVVVIGGGIVGLATAYNITLEGEQNLTVIEQGYLGSGASTRNAAHFRAHFWAPENAQFAAKSIEKLLEFASRIKQDFEIRRGGYLWLLYKEDEVEAFKENNNHLWSELGVAGKFLTPEEISEKYPYINVKDVLAGFLGPQDGKLNPFLVLRGYYEEIKRAGAKVLTHTKAQRIVVDNNKVKGVQTDRGFIEAEKILVAAGAWTNELLKSVDITLPIEPERKEIGVTESMNYFMDPLVISARFNAYVGQMVHGELIGSIEYPIVKGLVPLVNTLDWLDAYSHAISETIPRVKRLMFLRGWSGYYAMTPDNSHILGRKPEWPENLYVATGFSGHGFMMSHFAGELMAKNVLYDEVGYLMKAFLPTRFEEGRLIKESMVIG